MKVRIKKIRSLRNYTAGGIITTWVLEDEEGKFVYEAFSEEDAFRIAKEFNEEKSSVSGYNQAVGVSKEGCRDGIRG